MDGFDPVDELDGGLVREGRYEASGDPRSDPSEVAAPERADDHGPGITFGHGRDSGVPEPRFDGFRIGSGEHDNADVDEALRCHVRSNLPRSLVWPHPVHGGHGGRGVEVGGSTADNESILGEISQHVHPAGLEIGFPLRLDGNPEVDDADGHPSVVDGPGSGRPGRQRRNVDGTARKFQIRWALQRLGVMAGSSE